MAVTLTEAAARHVTRYLAKRGKGVGVRLGVKTTGCSGLAYKLEYVDEQEPEDVIFEDHGVKVLVDPKSLAYIDGTQLDFVREGLNEGFRFTTRTNVTVAVAANRSVFKARREVSEPALPLSAQLAVSDFELFGLPVQFAMDRAQLDARWKDLQREAHPDKFASQGTAAQRVAMQWSVRINEAYQRLKDPMRRAAYLCELGGAPIQAENNTAMPALFLMQQMEWREAMDDATDVAALEALHDEVQQAHQATLQQCAQLIDNAHDLPAAAQQVRGLMFIEKFLRDLEARID